MNSCSPTRPCTTVISFFVSVPVLSLQTAVAAPIVSQDASTRTMQLSFIMAFIEKARAMVTARGRPSGMATATNATAIRKKFRNTGRAPFAIVFSSVADDLLQR
jgi:hypothetical protein